MPSGNPAPLSVFPRTSLLVVATHCTSIEEDILVPKCTGSELVGNDLERPGTDVMIIKIFSPKNFGENVGGFCSR
jgi:hypothetical protein